MSLGLHGALGGGKGKEEGWRSQAGVVEAGGLEVIFWKVPSLR